MEAVITCVEAVVGLWSREVEANGELDGFLLCQSEDCAAGIGQSSSKGMVKGGGVHLADIDHPDLVGASPGGGKAAVLGLGNA